MYALYATGLSLRAVGRIFDVTGQRVQQIFQAEGLPTRGKGRPGRPRGPSVCKRCFEMYPYGQYSEHVRTPEHQAVPNPHRDLDRERAIVEDYLADRLTGEEIAVKHNITQEEIYRFLKNWGVKPNRNGGEYTRRSRTRARMAAAQRRRYGSLQPNGQTATGHNSTEDTHPRIAAAVGSDL